MLFVVTVSSGNPLTSIEYVIAQQNATDNLEQDLSPIATMIENVRDSVVGIILPGENLGPDYEYDGSGFVYDVDDDKAYVITNEHVISGYENEIVDVHFIDNDALFEANVTSTDPVADIAVVEITLDSNQTTSSPIEPLTLANSSEIRQGQQVFAIGSPFPTDASIPNTVTSGIISKPLHTIEYDEDGTILGAIVTDAPILGGNSGGPLLNMTGAVIGMMTTSDDGEPCCSYAIPSNTISYVVPTLLKDRKYEHPWIGLTPRTLPSTSDEDMKGVSVYSIEEDGPAHEAGLRGSTVNQFGELQMGDMITAVDGRPITTADEFATYIDQNKSVGDDVELTIYRNGTTRQITVTLE